MSPSKADFQVVLGQARELVRDQLELTEKTIMHVAEAAPAGIADRLVSLFESKGKRIRSTLLCLISNCGNVTPDAKRVAQSCASVELLHLASLVHDDIIDGTELRRGKETAHKKWGTQVAVLVGDYVLSQSMRCVIDEQEGDVPVIISDAADKLIVGEIMELDHCGELSLSRATYNEIIDGKTAALIEAAARIGGIMAGFDKPLIDECAKMGAHFGLAFQIIDDLLDYGYGSKNRPARLRLRLEESGQGEVYRPLERAHHASAPVLFRGLQCRRARRDGIAREACRHGRCRPRDS